MPVDRLIARSPEELGVSSAALETLYAAAEAEVTSGKVDACQVAVARHGRLAGMRTFGTTERGAATDSTLFHIFSATKATMAVAICALLEEGRFTLDTLVKDLIPGFGANGKDGVTVRMLVTFTAGFPAPPSDQFGVSADRIPELMATSSARTAQFAKWPLDPLWKGEPGSFWQYHAGSAHWVMAELVERVTGVDFRDYLRSHVLDPCGLCDFHVGMPAELQELYHISGLVGRDGVEPGPAGTTSVELRALGRPGGGGMATAADVALLYQPLINAGKVWGGGQVLSATTINNLLTKQHTDERHYTMLSQDPPVRVAKRRGVILELAWDDEVAVPTSHPNPAYAGKVLPAKIFRQGGFGYTNSAQAIGHDGAAGQIAWGDPATGLSFSWLTNTFTKLGQDQPRIVKLSTLACATLLPAAKL
jgi:CubicO group peptidase (beta-lactamase class C family)